jgi:hypothetical protein
MIKKPKEPTPASMNKLLMKLMLGVNGQVFRLIGNQVVYGPFKGMKIPEYTPWNDGNSSTKLLGSYEFELHDVIVRAIERKPRIVVNVGCAEGYYAIGFAMALPEATVYATDISRESLEQCSEFAKENKVDDRVVMKKGCDFAKELDILNIDELGRCLYFLDCEGYEINLLDKKECPSLLKSDIIVECHDFLNPGITDVLKERFSDTHNVELIKPRLPPLERYPFLHESPTVMSLLTIAEKRPMPTAWLACWTN